MKNITSKQPVLVTGATGFIGKRVVHRLLQHGIDTRALVLPGEAVPADWGERVQVVRGSITDRDAVSRAMEGAGTSIHLAAVVTDWGSEKTYWAITVEGSRHLFDAAVNNGTRVVLASSVAVYGDNIRLRECPEDTGYGKALGPYSRTKQAQEKLAWQYAEERDMAVTVVRPSNVYGPGSGPWLYDVVDVLLSGTPSLVGGGDINAGLAYVDNVADILLLAGTEDCALGRVYNACDGLAVTWKEYFSDIARIVGAKEPKSIPLAAARIGAVCAEAVWKLFRIKKRPPITREALNLAGSDNRFPCRRVQEELGYTPAVTYHDGMEEVRKYCAEHDMIKK